MRPVYPASRQSALMQVLFQILPGISVASPDDPSAGQDFTSFLDPQPAVTWLGLSERSQQLAGGSQRPGDVLQPEPQKVRGSVGEYALAQHEIERNLEAVQREIRDVAERRTLDLQDIVSQFLFYTLLDEPLFRLYSKVVSGPEIRYQHPVRSKGTTSHVGQAVGVPEPRNEQ